MRLIALKVILTLPRLCSISPFAFRDLDAVMAGTTVELTREQAAQFVTEVPPAPIAAEHAVEEAKKIQGPL
jgi:hypothetical protein